MTFQNKFRARSLRSLACATSLSLALVSVLAQAQESAAPGAAPAAAAQASQAAPVSMAVPTVSELATIPPPALTARAWMTLDANSGQVIAAQNLDESVEPASLTKLMSAYVVFDALENRRLTLDQKVPVSEKAWKTEGSRMFIEVNSQVSVDELLQGVIVQSGNDATVALAEAVAGSEEAFVTLMNEEAARQGLRDTHFENSTGLPGPTHLTTVRDLGTLARNLVQTFPQYMHYYSQKEFTYNNIKQSNRNRLLWADPTIDGLKTGHTQSAGFCLVTTAVRNGRRVVSVLVGAASDAARTENSLKLLNWSFQNFDTVKLYDASTPAVTAKVWEGETDQVGLGTPNAIWVTVPRDKAADVKPVAQYVQPLVAPLQTGAKVGKVTLSLDGRVLREDPLYVLADVPQAGFFSRMVDKVRLLFE